MPTYEQLRAESWWGREIVTAELDWLGDELCLRSGRPRTAAGSKGDNRHLAGGHRSQEWILHSRWCTDRDYTVQEGLTAEQARHVAAEDFIPGPWGTTANRRLMVAQTGRLWRAAGRGELDGVTQVLGTLDGRRAVGLNVLSGATFWVDSSHLDHWHLTFDRRRLTDRALMERIVDIALSEEDDMGALYDKWPEEWGNDPDGQERSPAQWMRDTAHALIWGTAAWFKTGPLKDVPKPWIVTKLDSIDEKVSVPAPIELSDAQLDMVVDRVAGRLSPLIEAVRAGVRADTRDAVADLGEGGAQAVRADS